MFIRVFYRHDIYYSTFQPDFKFVKPENLIQKVNVWYSESILKPQNEFVKW